MSMEEKDQEDVMQRLLELGGDKKFLTFDDLNRAPAGCAVFPLDISVTPQAGSAGAAAVRSVAVQASVESSEVRRAR